MTPKLQLIVKLQFAATHVLEENELVHPHTWRVDVTLEGENKFGRVISLPRAQDIFKSVIKNIEGTYLNTNSFLDNSTREIPTCENLCYFLLQRFSESLTKEASDLPSLRISVIEVAVSEDDDKELGAARLTL